MSNYVKLLRRVHCVNNNVCKIFGVECLSHVSHVNVQTKSFSLGVACEKHKGYNYKIERKNDEKLPDTTVFDNTPLIVKMMYGHLEGSKNKVEQETHNNKTLSVAGLQQSLDHISWDVEAQMNKKLKEVASADFEEKPHIYSDLYQGDFIEHIDLDEKTLPTRKQGKSHSHILRDITGTPDPTVPKTDIACSGCGAMLHCQDSSAAGYMPSEKLKVLTRNELKSSICQRCHLMNHHNICLNAKVDEMEYQNIISKINRSRGLVMVVVDLTDFPNSIFKTLLQHVGRNRPLLIIGNKVDLIAKDEKGYLNRIKESLIKECNINGLNPSGRNLMHVCLVSAKTGYGIEELVTKLMSRWKLKGNVFLVGSTNVGKSSLFNALLGSDYCKTHVRDLIHRATVSTWPGTTVSVLKFPIVNPESGRLQARIRRLMDQRLKEATESRLQNLQTDKSQQKKTTTLSGKIGQTDFRTDRQKFIEDTQEFEGQEIVSFELTDKETLAVKSSHVEEVIPPDMSFDEKLTRSLWTFDTPGVVNNEQLINLLSPEELQVVLPRSVIVPRVFIVKPSQVLFVSGLGRIDYVQGDKSIYLTVHSSAHLPVFVVDEKDSEEFYNQRVGTKQLGVPLGLSDRPTSLPALESKDIDVLGNNWEMAAVDIQLSSLGWVSVTAGFDMRVTLRAYTPGGRGIYVRSPALLPYYSSFRGTRIGKTPTYRTKKHKAN